MPILSGQSAGLGTNEGDQQYVKGILSASARPGPSVLDMGSKSNEWRQVLMRSPSLQATVRRYPIPFTKCAGLTLAKSTILRRDTIDSWPDRRETQSP